MEQAENAGASSGQQTRGRSTVTKRQKFDLAARTLLARAGKLFFSSCPLSLLAAILPIEGCTVLQISFWYFKMLNYCLCPSFLYPFFWSAGLYRTVQAHRNQGRRDGVSLQQEPGALYDLNLDEELEIDLDDEAMEAMFGQELASDNDILGMWIPEVLDWPTWVCDSSWSCSHLCSNPLPLALLPSMRWRASMHAASS